MTKCWESLALCLLVENQPTVVSCQGLLLGRWEKINWPKWFKGSEKSVSITSLSVSVLVFSWHVDRFADISLKKRKKKRKKRVSSWWTTKDFLVLTSTPASTPHFTLILPSTLLNLSGTPGVVLIILLAGGNKPGLWAALVLQFRALMAASEWIRARGNPTGWSTGVRSAGVAAITSHHSLYWPPPIGFLLNLKHMQLFLLGGSNLKASLRCDKELVQQSSSAPMYD